MLRAPLPQVAKAWQRELLYQPRHSSPQPREGQHQPTSPRDTHSLRGEHPGPATGFGERTWHGSATQGLSVVMQQPRETPAQMRERREKEREQQDMAEELRRRIQAQSDAEMRWARAHGLDSFGGEIGVERQLGVAEKDTTWRERDLRAHELLWMPVSQAAEMERERLRLREMQLKREQWERERDARMQQTFEWVKEKELEKERDKEREREQERMEGDLDDNSVVNAMRMRYMNVHSCEHNVVALS